MYRPNSRTPSTAHPTDYQERFKEVIPGNTMLLCIPQIYRSRTLQYARHQCQISVKGISVKDDISVISWWDIWAQSTWQVTVVKPDLTVVYPCSDDIQVCASSDQDYLCQGNQLSQSKQRPSTQQHKSSIIKYKSENALVWCYRWIIIFFS